MVVNRNHIDHFVLLFHIYGNQIFKLFCKFILHSLIISYHTFSSFHVIVNLEFLL